MRFSWSTHLLTCFSLETLTSITKTDLPILVELIDLVNSYNFSISNDLTQMVNFPTRIPDCDSLSPALLDLFISSYFLVFVLQWLSLHLESLIIFVSVSIDFPSYSQQDAPFHRISSWLERSLWSFERGCMEGIFKLSASSAASEYCECVQVGIDVYIPHWMYHRSSLNHLHGFQLLVLLP